MTSDLTFTLFRLGYLVLLWLLVLGAVSTLRRDIFGTVVTPRGKGRKDADRKRREFFSSPVARLWARSFPSEALRSSLDVHPHQHWFWKTSTHLPNTRV